MKIGEYEIKRGTAVACAGLSLDERKQVANILVEAGANITCWSDPNIDTGKYKYLLFSFNETFTRCDKGFLDIQESEGKSYNIINGKDLLAAYEEQQSGDVKHVANNIQWDESIRGPRMSGDTGNRIWKYQMPVAEKFEMKLPKGAQIIRMAGENGYLWLWAVVDTSAPLETRQFEAFKAGGTMPDDLSNHVFRGMAHIYIQQELMLYIFEIVEE